MNRMSDEEFKVSASLLQGAYGVDKVAFVAEAHRAREREAELEKALWEIAAETENADISDYWRCRSIAAAALKASAAKETP